MKIQKNKFMEQFSFFKDVLFSISNQKEKLATVFSFSYLLFILLSFLDPNINQAILSTEGTTSKVDYFLLFKNFAHSIIQLYLIGMIAISSVVFSNSNLSLKSLFKTILNFKYYGNAFLLGVFIMFSFFLFMSICVPEQLLSKEGYETFNSGDNLAISELFSSVTSGQYYTVIIGFVVFLIATLLSFVIFLMSTINIFVFKEKIFKANKLAIQGVFKNFSFGILFYIISVFLFSSCFELINEVFNNLYFSSFFKSLYISIFGFILYSFHSKIFLNINDINPEEIDKENIISKYTD